MRSTHLRLSQRLSSGSSPATSAPSRLSRASWRSWTRRSCPTSRRASPTTWRGWSSSAARSGLCDVRSLRTVRSSSLWHIPSSICCRPRRSAERFAALESRVTQAVDAAREAKESTRGSFDLLVARIGQRTNDIMKVLTLVTVILLPSTVLAGVMGMNFQLGLFDLVWMFWAVIAAMLGIAVLVLSVARSSTLDLAAVHGDDGARGRLQRL